jgi:hypothetical protein
LDGPHNRQDIGRKLIGCGAVRRVRFHRRLSGSRIAELGAGGFLRCKGGLGTGRDQRPLILSERRVKMEHKRVRVGAELGDDEQQPLRHQPRNEMHVSGEPIEIRDDNGTVRLASVNEGVAELWTAVERVGALSDLGLNKLAHEIG